MKDLCTMAPAQPAHLYPLLMEKLRHKKVSPELAESFKDILLTPKIQANDHRAEPALKWVASDPVLAKLLPKHKSDRIRDLVFPLLSWGIKQTWADAIQPFFLVQHWFEQKANASRPSAQTTTASKEAFNTMMAAHVVRACVQNNQAPKSIVHQLSSTWIVHLGLYKALMNPNNVKPEKMPLLHQALVDSTAIALHEDTAKNNGKRQLFKRWLSDLDGFLKPMPLAMQSQALLVFLQSELPHKVIATMCHQALPSSWLEPEVCRGLRPLLHPVDTDCYAQLPWAAFNGTLSFQEVVSANQSLVGMYCPSLAPALSLVLNPDDWFVRSVVTNAIQTVNNHKKVIDVFDVSDLVM